MLGCCCRPCEEYSRVSGVICWKTCCQHLNQQLSCWCKLVFNASSFGNCPATVMCLLESQSSPAQSPLKVCAPVQSCHRSASKTPPRKPLQALAADGIQTPHQVFSHSLGKSRVSPSSRPPSRLLGRALPRLWVGAQARSLPRSSPTQLSGIFRSLEGVSVRPGSLPPSSKGGHSYH